MLRRPTTRIRLDLRISPVEAEERLRRAVGPLRSFLLSPTWGRQEDLVGQVNDGRIRVRVRHGYSNGLARLLYGRVTSTGSGSRVEGEFRTLWWVVLILRTVYLVFVLLIAAYCFDVVRQGRWPRWPDVLAPTLTMAFVVGVEAIARRMGDRDEQVIRDHLSRLFADSYSRATMTAETVPTSPEFGLERGRAWRPGDEK